MNQPGNISDELAGLLARVCDESLPDDELRRLEQLLAADPAARQLYIDHLLLDTMLNAELGQDGVAAVIDLFGEDVAPTPTVVAMRWWFQWKGAALAAAVLLAVGAGLWGFLSTSPRHVPIDRPAPAPALAQVTECDGRLDLMSPEGGAAPAGAGQTVRPGQSLRTGEDSFAVLTRDAVLVELTSDTTVRLLDEDQAGRDGRVYLSQGVVRVAAGPAADGHPTVVSTPHVSIVVSSATFTCSATTDATYLEVEEGKVQMVRQADGATLEVIDGFMAVASADVDEQFAARRLPIQPPQPPTILKDKGVHSLVFSGKGASLIGVSSGRLADWDVKTGLRTQMPDLAIADWRGTVVSADGRIAAVYGKKHGVKLIELAESRELMSVVLSGRGIHAVALSSDGARLAVTEQVEKKQMVSRVWDVRMGVELPPLRTTGRTARVVALSADGTLLALGHDEGDVTLGDATAGRELARFHLPGKVQTLAFSPDGLKLAGAGAGGTLVVWDVTTRTESWRVQAPGRPFLSVIFSPGGRFLATGTADGAVKVWRTDDGAEQLSLKATHPSVAALAFSPDGALLAAATKRPVLLWQLPDEMIDPQRTRRD